MQKTMSGMRKWLSVRIAQVWKVSRIVLVWGVGVRLAPP